MIQIQFATSGDAAEKISDLHGKLLPKGQRDLMAVMGRQAQNSLRAHFRKREASSPNKQGWSRQHFWNRLAIATSYDPSKTTSDSATVIVADPALAMKVSGGTIRPTNGRRMLAIPIAAPAYGHRPSDGTIPDLKVVRMGESLYLGRKEGGAQNSFTKYYRLVPSVSQAADPQALPDESSVNNDLLRVATNFFTS